jgi:hypothetical protein
MAEAGISPQGPGRLSKAPVRNLFPQLTCLSSVSTLSRVPGKRAPTISDNNHITRLPRCRGLQSHNATPSLPRTAMRHGELGGAGGDACLLRRLVPDLEISRPSIVATPTNDFSGMRHSAFEIDTGKLKPFLQGRATVSRDRASHPLVSPGSGQGSGPPGSGVPTSRPQPSTAVPRPP